MSLKKGVLGFGRSKSRPLFAFVAPVEAGAAFGEEGALLELYSNAKAFVLAGAMVVACVWDLRTRRIPNALILGSVLAGAALAAAEGGLPAAGWALAGMIVGGGVLLPFAAGGVMGAGDVKLLGAAGTFMGPAAALRGVLIGAVLGGIWALLWMAVKKEGRKGTLPYAPPLALGALISFFL